VTYDANMPSYPQDIHYTGRSKSEYFANIDRALAEGWRLENAINGFRWLAYNFVTCTVTVSEDFGKFELRNNSLWWRFWRGFKSRLPALGRTLDLLGWRDSLPGARIVSAMLIQGHDALPPARMTLNKPVIVSDTGIVIKSLARLHALLYAKSSLSFDKPGLSRKLIACIGENLQ
jgi:hypothetical protein